MSEPTETKPTATDVAVEIATLVHNSGQAVSLTNADLKEISGREKLREGFKKPIIDMLLESGHPVTVGQTAIIVAPRPENERPLTLEEARAENAEAQQTGVRNNPNGGQSWDVIPPKDPAK